MASIGYCDPILIPTQNTASVDCGHTVSDGRRTVMSCCAQAATIMIGDGGLKLLRGQVVGLKP
jgi:hypothetical protein